MNFIPVILKYYRFKNSRWKWNHRFYDDLYSEVFDRLQKENPNTFQENIAEALKKVESIFEKRGYWSEQEKAYLPVKVYTLSPNSHTKRK